MNKKLIISWLYMFIMGAFLSYVFTLGRISHFKEHIDVMEKMMMKASQQYKFQWESVK